ncbi:hypothetical protein EDB92DRAFT_1914884 [Lactarius akahatsu]|uniref:Uncharacterized protein n=1 Tax=Lactarius akahatsu TaxID=416441 RepID=A0AAD4L4L8_9AGAM|nr:hypothetical protein EDB92DRAFT_1914884 [Lactarius akahatsu]
MHARASSLGLCPPGPRSLCGRPRGRWKSCARCRARRSDSSEWPNRIVEGLIGVRRCFCTSVSVVVTGNATVVIAEKLDYVRERQFTCKLPGTTVIGVLQFNRLIIYCTIDPESNSITQTRHLSRTEKKGTARGSCSACTPQRGAPVCVSSSPYH